MPPSTPLVIRIIQQGSNQFLIRVEKESSQELLLNAGAKSSSQAAEEKAENVKSTGEESENYHQRGQGDEKVVADLLQPPAVPGKPPVLLGTTIECDDESELETIIELLVAGLPHADIV